MKTDRWSLETVQLQIEMTSMKLVVGMIMVGLGKAFAHTSVQSSIGHMASTSSMHYLLLWRPSLQHQHSTAKRKHEYDQLVKSSATEWKLINHQWLHE